MKAAAAPEKKKAAIERERAALVDELGSLEAELAPQKPKIARIAALKKIIEPWADADGVKEVVGTLYHGERYSAIVSAKETKRRIVSMPKVMKAVSARVFLERCSFTLADADKLLTSEQAKHLIAEDFGPRRVSSCPRAA